MSCDAGSLFSFPHPSGQFIYIPIHSTLWDFPQPANQKWREKTWKERGREEVFLKEIEVLLFPLTQDKNEM